MMIEVRKKSNDYLIPSDAAGKFYLNQYNVKKEVDDVEYTYKIVKTDDVTYKLMTRDTNCVTGYIFTACCIEELLNKILDEPEFKIYLEE